jgi:DNA-binding MarR family transcriptional regulator
MRRGRQLVNHSSGDDPLDLGSLDKVIHSPARLKILMYLFSVKHMDFVFLQNATELTNGNLSTHLSKLEEAGYVKIDKSIVKKRPRTRIQITPHGKEAVEEYEGIMRDAFDKMRG